MMALAAVNVLGAVVFAGIYAASGTGRLPPAAFLVGLPVAFIAITALWVRVEDRSRALDPMVRVGRGAIGLLAVLIGLPVVVLMPLFWLESQLPARGRARPAPRSGDGAPAGRPRPGRGGERRGRGRGHRGGARAPVAAPRGLTRGRP